MTTAIALSMRKRIVNMRIKPKIFAIICVPPICK